MVESQLLKFKVDNKFLDINNEYNGVLKNIQNLELNLQNLDFELSYYKSLQTYLSSKKGEYSEILAPSVVGINDAFLNQSIEQLIELSLEKRKLLNLVQGDHPNLKLLEDQIKRIRENIFENINNLITNTEFRKSEIQSKLKSNASEFSTFPQVESAYGNIFREYRLRENIYNYLLEKRAEVGIAKASNISDNSILDYAKRGNLIFPNVLKNYGYAIAIGFLLPLFILIIYY